jgi:hypothetical protein
MLGSGFADLSIPVPMEQSVCRSLVLAAVAADISQ